MKKSSKNHLYFSMNMKRFMTIIFLSIMFIGCTSKIKDDGPPNFLVNVNKIPDAKPKLVALSKYGNPSSYIVNGKRYYVLKTANNYEQRGIASWYGTKFHGQLTSTREPYNMLAMTGASPILPIPCFVRVTNLRNGRSVVIKVNDRGPFVFNRIIDLSYVAAKKLNYLNKGTALVDVKAITSSPHVSHPIMPKKVTYPAKLFLQLGAFYELSHAKNLKIQLHNCVKKPILIIESIYNYLPLYRVQIGPLQSISESHYLQSKLKKLGFTVIIVN